MTAGFRSAPDIARELAQGIRPTGKELRSLRTGRVRGSRPGKPMDYSLTLTDVADDAIRKAIVAPLVAYNESQAGASHGRALVVEVRDAANAVIGGLWGTTGYGWLFTQLLVVPAELRGQGVGTQIMRLAEAEAVARGCRGAWLDTFEFQARAFYEGLGYTCFGELPNYPPGFSRFFMQKELALPAN